MEIISLCNNDLNDNDDDLSFICAKSDRTVVDDCMELCSHGARTINSSLMVRKIYYLSGIWTHIKTNENPLNISSVLRFCYTSIRITSITVNMASQNFISIFDIDRCVALAQSILFNIETCTTSLIKNLVKANCNAIGSPQEFIYFPLLSVASHFMGPHTCVVINEDW